MGSWRRHPGDAGDRQAPHPDTGGALTTKARGQRSAARYSYGRSTLSYAPRARTTGLEPVSSRSLITEPLRPARRREGRGQSRALEDVSVGSIPGLTVRVQLKSTSSAEAEPLLTVTSASGPHGPEPTVRAVTAWDQARWPLPDSNRLTTDNPALRPARPKMCAGKWMHLGVIFSRDNPALRPAQRRYGR